MLNWLVLLNTYIHVKVKGSMAGAAAGLIIAWVVSMHWVLPFAVASAIILLCTFLGGYLPRNPPDNPE